MDYKNCKVYDSEAEQIIRGLKIADCMNILDLEIDPYKTESTVPYNLKELVVADVLSCSYCNISFLNASEQRNHYKLDWHRYNLKRALSGNQSIPEDIFDTLADDVSSISGSDSESSSGVSDIDVSEPVKKSSWENFGYNFRTIRHTKVFFENDDNKILSVYKCLLQNKKESLTKEELVKNAFNLIRKTKKWLVVMLGGGHFAGAVFDNGNIIYHKTFHCYTVRAKQGGSQFTKDNKGGNHPKSAGASLRRYNEQALIQHVQDIMTVWSEQIKQCSLILYRATGPYNRGVLFGGKNPLLSKTDHRLRNIPFPTRRATFKELKRVYEVLASLEIYGSADDFKDKFPCSPDKRVWSPKNKEEQSKENNLKSETSQAKKEKPSPRKDRSKARASPQREIPGENIRSSCESENSYDDDIELLSSDITISFQGLQEFEDTVPEYIRKLKRETQSEKKKKKSKKPKGNSEKKKLTKELEKIQDNLITSCQNGDLELLMENLRVCDTLPERIPDPEEDEKTTSVFTKKDFINCLNAPVNEDNKNTLLHLAAINSLPEFVTRLMTAGADPTMRNKNKLTPYIVASNKETRNSFRSFAASFPDKYDLKKANIPEPLTGEMEKELDEKRKERKKLKRIKEKAKKQENKEKSLEKKEKEKFLALSDREKCALVAERHFIASTTANQKLAKPPVLSRCFQCGTDITGKIPFEYGTNRFCSIPCLKAHRLKTNSYGMEI